MLTQYINKTSAYQAFQVLRYGFILLTAVAFSYIFNEDPASLSAYEQFLLVSGYLTSFWVSGLFNTFLTVYYKAPDADKPQLIRQTFLTAAAASGGAAILFFIIFQFIDTAFSPLAIAGFTLFIFLNSVTYFTEFLLLIREKFMILILYGFAVHALQFAILAGMLAGGFGFGPTAWALVLLGGVRLIILLMLTGRSLWIRGWDQQLWRMHMQTALPFILALVLGGSADYIDGFLVMALGNDESLVIFRYGAKELPFVMLLANAMSTVMAGEISAAAAGGRQEESLLRLKQSSMRLIHRLFPIAILLMIFSKPLYKLVFADQVEDSYLIFDIYLLLVVPRLAFPQTVLRGLNLTRPLAWIAFVELILNVTLSLVFFQFWGIWGIAMATVFAYIIERMIMFSYIRINLNIYPESYTPLFSLIIFGVLLMMAFFIKLIIMEPEIVVRST